MSGGFRWLCSLGLIGLMGTPCASVLPPAFSRIDDQGAIPDKVVTALAQSPEGFIWVGTAGGLLRYDGYRFQRFSARPDDPTSLPGNLVRSILVAKDHRVWIGTDVDGLAVMDPTTGRFTRYQHRPDRADSIVPGALFALAEDAQGGIWVGSVEGGLSHLARDGQRFEHHAGPQQGETLQVNALLVDRSGQLWIGTTDGLYQKSPTGPVRAYARGTPASDLLADSTVYSLFQASDDSIWIGTREGHRFRLRPTNSDEIQLEQLAADGDIAAGVTLSAYAIVEVAEQIWIGLQDGIEIRQRDSAAVIERIDHRPGVRASPAGSDLRALLVDRAGLVWAGGFGSGLQWHDPAASAIAVLRDELSGQGAQQNNITAVLVRRNGEIWLGTRGNGLRVLDQQLRPIRQLLPGTEALPPMDLAWVTAMDESPDGTLWLGSREGVWRMSADGRRLRHVAQTDRPAGLSVRRLLVQDDGAVWVGARNALLHFDPRSETLRSVTTRALPQDINALQLDHRGILWVGAVGGLFQVLPGESELREVAAVAGHELRHRSVLGLLLDSQQRLWIDTPQGLHRLRETAVGYHFDPIGLRLSAAKGEAQEMSGDFGANLLEDAAGQIWSQRYRFDPQQQTVYVLTRADGVDFGTGWYRSFDKTADGRLLYGGSEGLLVIDPQRFRPWTYEAPLRVTEWRVQGRPRAIGALSEGFTLAPDERSFALEFAALDFTLPEACRYRYRLLGFDQEWSQADAGYRVASYSNLWPGEYWLEVQGSNRTGRLSGQLLRLPIVVRPAWWQTSWALGLGALGLLALGYLVLRWRTRRIEKQAMRLRRLVDSQTGELLQSTQRAEQALADLLATQQQLVQTEKLAALGELVAGVAHEVNTPLGIALTAASHLEEETQHSSRKLEEGNLRRSELLHWQGVAIESLRMILGSLERASELVGRFKQLAIDSRHENAVSMDIKNLAENLADSARISLKDLPIEVELNVVGFGELSTYPGALFRVITQLALNAAQHAFDKSGGRLRIDCRLDNESLHLAVEDDGAGMRGDTAARAFDPFFTTQRSRGAGLGLHMVHNTVCRALGGNIQLHSELGKGSRFVIRIPRWQGSAGGG